MTKITKAVVAAAGLGTRFLPQTKAMPKEMLPLIDKPIIQYVIEELVSVGITDIVIVTGQNKRSIEDHFDKPSEELINILSQGGSEKKEMIKVVEDISNMANFIYVRQKGPYGNGTPLLNCEHLIADEPFIYTWSDDFIVSSPARFQQMIDCYQEYLCPVMSLIKVASPLDYTKYGIASGKTITDGIIDINDLSEKPGVDRAKSDLATVSGFLLTPEIFPYLHNCLDNLVPEKEELYCNAALKLMLLDHKRIIGKRITNGKYFDAGNKLDYIKANISLALDNSELKADLLVFLKELIKDA